MVPELGIVGLDITKAVSKLMPDLRRPAGVVVAARKTNAPYSGPLLQVGDVIYEVNRHVVRWCGRFAQCPEPNEKRPICGAAD